MERNKQHLLLVRFSALGDILMTVPVIRSLSRQYPDLKITVVSRPYVGSIFERLSGNIHFVGINPRNYSGLFGLYRLFKEVKSLSPTHYCDLHDVLRTKFLTFMFRLTGIPTSHIVKDLKARKAFIESEVKSQQETSFERYAKAINALFPFSLDPHALGQPAGKVKIEAKEMRIGIAPFAAHKGKIYPLDKTEQVVRILSSRVRDIYLFGAGESEKSLMEQWDARYGNVHSMVGQLSNMAAEMNLIEQLDLMLTMDSGNMHLASLTSTPVYSIWGATHPLGGFLGWNQPMDRCIQKDLACRPCSIFGNKPCKFGNYPCLDISPEEIAERLLRQ